jgi:hypothetical protein
MSDPELPWYPVIERALRPIEPYNALALGAIAIVCLWVAFRGDAVTKTALLVWLVSP